MPYNIYNVATETWLGEEDVCQSILALPSRFWDTALALSGKGGEVVLLWAIEIQSPSLWNLFGISWVLSVKWMRQEEIVVGVLTPLTAQYSPCLSWPA